jgi:hypothetical protein
VPRDAMAEGFGAILATLFISIAVRSYVERPAFRSNKNCALARLGRAQGLWRIEDMGTLADLGAWQIVTSVLTIGASALSGGKVSDVLALRAPAGGVCARTPSLPV